MGHVFTLIGQYGYWIVLFGVMAESAGLPLPGETILIASGVLVQQGNLDLPHVLLFGISGAIIGDQIGYWAGWKGGRPFVTRWGRYVRITPERLDRAEAFFGRHGGKAVFLARFVLGLRVFGALAAGVSRMNWRTFTFYNALGGMTWATAAVSAGYLLGGSIGLLDRWIGRASLLLALNAWCELSVQSLNGRCPQRRVGLLTDPTRKGTDSLCSMWTPSSPHFTSW